MKLLIAGDIHGSAKYALALRELFLTQWPDRLILTGDLLNHGPRNDPPEAYAPQEVINILNGMKERIIAVQGNCDSDVDQMVLEFPLTGEIAMLFVDGHTVCVTHGHLYGPSGPPPLASGDILLCGHTHRGEERAMGDKVYLNPGSIALPKDGQNSYMIYDAGTFTRFNLSGAVLGRWKA